MRRARGSPDMSVVITYYNTHISLGRSDTAAIYRRDGGLTTLGTRCAL